MPNRVVIIGGGFCGTVLAANLLRRPPAAPTEIVLIERCREMGRGVAYAIHEYPYLLNVPAGRLSADSQDPMQFLRFAQRTLPDVDAEDFLLRRLYGNYVQDFLAQAERAAPAHVRLTRVFDEATRISRGDGNDPVLVEFSDRAPIGAQRVVLAVGNPPPPILPWAEAIRHHPAYHDNPWVPGPRWGPQHTVLIIGNGLTMTDVASALCRDFVQAPRLLTISRHGLVPLPQSNFRAAAVQGGAEVLGNVSSVRQLLAASRRLARDVEGLGGDWREAVTFIRNVAPSIWQRVAEIDRRRFVRHLQCYWDVHRHRLPPLLAERIAYLRDSGKLDVNAGRIEELVAEGERLHVRWRVRGSTAAKSMLVDAVINATGPDYSLARSRDTLLKALRNEGWVSEDALNLGLRTTREGACIAGDGSVSEHLFYLGPMLRATHWEATAATELRNHAERLARLLTNG